MDIMGFIKFLPAELQKAFTQTLALFQEKNIAPDLDIVMTEIEKTLSLTAKNPALDKKLRHAFNDVANLTSIGKDVLKDQKISMLTTAKLASNRSRFKESLHAFREAADRDDPAVVALAETLKKNDKFYDAVKRLVANTNGRLFTLEAGENGTGYAVDLMTGKSMKVPLKKEDYEELLKILAEKKKTPPAPPSPSA